MMYYDYHKAAWPKHIVWHKVILSSEINRSKLDAWCIQHSSIGRYCRRYRQRNDDFDGIAGAVWYFELAADAILFALKWK